MYECINKIIPSSSFSTMGFYTHICNQVSSDKFPSVAIEINEKSHIIICDPLHNMPTPFCCLLSLLSNMTLPQYIADELIYFMNIMNFRQVLIHIFWFSKKNPFLNGLDIEGLRNFSQVFFNCNLTFLFNKTSLKEFIDTPKANVLFVHVCYNGTVERVILMIDGYFVVTTKSRPHVLKITNTLHCLKVLSDLLSVPKRDRGTLYIDGETCPNPLFTAYEMKLRSTLKDNAIKGFIKKVQRAKCFLRDFDPSVVYTPSPEEVAEAERKRHRNKQTLARRKRKWSRISEEENLTAKLEH